jgi:Ca-activated chloride channel homolog
MRTLRHLALAVLAFVGSEPALGEDERTLSPYFVVEGGDPSVDRFPLAATEVEVVISGVIADVTVTQVYENQGRRPIDARYVFPASTRAAVNGLSLRVRDQLIEAEIQEKKQAQQTFRRAKQEGRAATLLEQQRPNVFSMSVANVIPGDRVEVTLRYNELLVPAEGRYEFVFPTVVGPRYASAAAKPEPNGGVGTPVLPEGAPPRAKFGLSGVIAASLPLHDVASATHALAGELESERVFRFALAADEEPAADRDFVLGYRLAGEAIQSGLSLFDAGDEKFFLLLVEPPARVEVDAMPPRELVFVVDVSGSMHGFPLDTAKHLLRRLAATLRPVDRFNVLLFSGGSRLLAPASLPATADNVEAALDVLERENGGGGTELLPALERALALPAEPGLSRSFLVVTDGYVAADREAIGWVAAHLGEANVFAFGIGGSVNRLLIEGLAHAGQGEPFVVTDAREADEAAERFAAYVSAPVLTDVKVTFEGFEAYAVEPSAVPDVLAARPVVVLGKWRGTPGGAVHVTGVSGAGVFSAGFDVASAVPRPEDAALAQLWARKRIAALGDFGVAEPSQAVQREIVALGLHHRLLTAYTSFVAVARVVRSAGEASVPVEQPVPLPRGVSVRALGVTVASEPTLALLVAALAPVLAAHLWLRSKRGRSFERSEVRCGVPDF